MRFYLGSLKNGNWQKGLDLKDEHQVAFPVGYCLGKLGAVNFSPYKTDMWGAIEEGTGWQAFSACFPYWDRVLQLYQKGPQQNRGCQSELKPKPFQKEVIYLGRGVADRGKSHGQAASRVPAEPAGARSCQCWDGCCSNTGLASGSVNIAQALGRWGEKGNHCDRHLNAPEPFISRNGSCPYT